MFIDEGVTETESPAVEEEETGVTEEVVATEPTEESPTEETVEVAEPVTETTYDTPTDRSFENKYREADRKFNELSENLPSMIEEAVTKANSKGTEAPKYTVSQLEQYAIENPEYRPWVEEQKETLRQDQIAKTVDAQLSAEKKQMADQNNRNQAYGHVQSNFPELFVKDKSGNTAWDSKNPLVGSIANYMKDPRLSNSPDGIVVATKLAYADHYRTNATTIKTKAKLAESSLKKEQRKTMVGGNGAANVQDRDAYSIAMERLRNKRDKASAAGAITEILKAQGMIQ